MNKMKKILGIMFAFAMTILLAEGVFGYKAQAAKPDFYSDSYQFMFCPEWDTFGLEIRNLAPNAKVKVSVSDTSLGKVEWDVQRKVAWVTAYKPCSFDVKFVVKQGGKTYKHTTKMTWVKYNNPLKSIKIGAKSYNTSYFNDNTSAGMKKVSGKSKVNVKLKAGYKLTGLGFSRGGKWKSISNGSYVNFSKKGQENTVLFVYYKDPQGNNGTLRLFVWPQNTGM